MNQSKATLLLAVNRQKSEVMQQAEFHKRQDPGMLNIHTKYRPHVKRVTLTQGVTLMQGVTLTQVRQTCASGND